MRALPGWMPGADKDLSRGHNGRSDRGRAGSTGWGAHRVHTTGWGAPGTHYGMGVTEGTLVVR